MNTAEEIHSYGQQVEARRVALAAQHKPEALASFTNSETGMTSFVVANSKAGFNVTLRDDDSGEFVSTAICGFRSFVDAVEKAREVVEPIK